MRISSRRGAGLFLIFLAVEAAVSAVEVRRYFRDTRNLSGVDSTRTIQACNQGCLLFERH